MDAVAEGEHLASVVFENPKNGTSMEQFQQMVSEYLVEKLGSGDHISLIKTIMDVADVNHDSKVSVTSDSTSE